MTRFPVYVYGKAARIYLTGKLSGYAGFLQATGFSKSVSPRCLVAPGAILLDLIAPVAGTEDFYAQFECCGNVLLWLKPSLRPPHVALSLPVAILSRAHFAFGERACGLAVPGALLVSRPTEAERWQCALSEFVEEGK